MSDYTIIFKILGGLLIPLSIIYTIVSYMVRGILEEHGDKVRNIVIDPIGDYKKLKKIENNNSNYILIRKVYLIISLSILSILGLLLISLIIFPFV